jgi:hypothetical protein
MSLREPPTEFTDRGTNEQRGMRPAADTGADQPELVQLEGRECIYHLAIIDMIHRHDTCFMSALYPGYYFKHTTISLQYRCCCSVHLATWLQLLRMTERYQFSGKLRLLRMTERYQFLGKLRLLRMTERYHF